MTKIENLNEIQLDALQETGNIGCSHAATAVSQMVNKEITISVPTIKVKKISELIETLNDIAHENEKIVGVYLELTQEFLGSILFLFPYKSALSLADILMCQNPGTSKELDEMGKSAITEVGNIVVSAYTNALGAFLNTTVMLSPPTFAYDMPNAVMEKISKSLGKETDFALLFDTKFQGENNQFISYFILIPSPQSLDILLEKLSSCIQNNQDEDTNEYLKSLAKKNGVTI